jgi:hypothetical protein
VLLLVVVGCSACWASVLFVLRARSHSRDRKLERAYVPRNVAEAPAGYLERGHSRTARGPYDKQLLHRTTSWGGSPIHGNARSLGGTGQK